MVKSVKTAGEACIFLMCIVFFMVKYNEFKLFILYSFYPLLIQTFECYPLDVVSRCRDPQLQVGENNSYLLNFKSNICNYRLLNIYI